jgi:membrane-associated phospholipid phosphatase
MLPFLEQYDLAAHYVFQGMHRAWLTRIMLVVTHLGDRQVLVSLTIAAAVITFLLDQRRTAVLLLLALGLAAGTHEGVSRWVARPRPDVANPLIERSSTGSFPSGAATLSMTVYGCLAIVLARRQKRGDRKLLIGLAAGVVILLIGFSRLYLCAHYMTDVLGGWCVGLAFVMLFLWGEQKATPLRQVDARLSRFSTVPSAEPRFPPGPPSASPRSIRDDGSVGPPNRFTPNEP